MIFMQFKTLFDVSKYIFGLQSFYFFQNIWGLFVFREFKSSETALGAFLTVENKKYCVFLNFNIKFTKFKKLHQKSAVVGF